MIFADFPAFADVVIAEAGAALPRLDTLPACRPCWNKLEQAGWNEGLVFESHGVRLGIRTNAPALLKKLVSLLPPGSVLAPTPYVETLYSLHIPPPSRSGVRRRHLLYQNAVLLAGVPTLEEALDALGSDLHRQVAERARDRLFVHAGVVGWNGCAVVIPGRSFRGKTHLTASLVQAGANYFSDEYAVFDASGLVWPYPKPLSLRDADGIPFPKRTAEELGGRTAAAPLPVGLILDTRFVPGAPWRPRRLSPGAALMTLLDNTVQLRREPQKALAILHQAASGAAAMRSRRGEAEAVADWMTSTWKNHCEETES